MKHPRRLSLRRDTLAELAPAELARVAGGDTTICLTDKIDRRPIVTIDDCPITGPYPSIPVTYCA